MKALIDYWQIDELLLGKYYYTLLHSPPPTNATKYDSPFPPPWPGPRCQYK